MDAAVDLNLKLMRWRVLPNLDIAKIQSTKVLLVGSGTLGCNVARSLLGWGVKNFTFIDNGRVSHSNPVRQSLFTFEDCAGIGKYKVHAAAEALQRIYPGVQAQGVVMSIPMPGHEASSVSALDEALVTCDALHALIESHDIIYLLTDTRESRWLPTLIAQALNKPCINAALGFNSYVVMRHGARDVLENQEEKTVVNDISSVSENSEHLEHPEHPEPQPESEQTSTKKESSNLDILRSYQSSLPFKYPSLDFSKPPHLGCYFCSDVVAPSNSMRDRTLDQQCTVTRPGLSMISSGLVAELTVAMLHHSKNYLAPAITFNADDEANEEKAKAHEYTTDDDCSGIGMLPHQMRGDMYTFEHQLLVGGAQSVCSGCGDTVVQMYRNDRRAFITKVINETGYLEEACGLAQLQREAEEALQQIEEWNNDSFDGDDF